MNEQIDKDAIWLTALGEFEVTLSKANFSTWLKDSYIAEINNETVIIGVRSIFCRNWLVEKFNDEILFAMQKLIPDIMNVEYIISTKPKSNAGSMGNSNEIFLPSAPNSDSKKDINFNDDISLDNKYNFDNFIVGSSNKLSHAAATAIVENPGTTYNPLFIWGGNGLGKTHLLQAIGNALVKQKGINVLYTPCETFINDYIKAVQKGSGKPEKFKDYYRLVDALIIDDVQFLAGKEGTQEEFFHTFNYLHRAKKQIILSADRPPKAIPTLEDRLKSRFGWGIITDIGAPDFEMRKAILREKSAEKNQNFEDEVIDYIAQNIHQNIRELEGALNRFIAYLKSNDVKPSKDTVHLALTGLINPKKQTLNTKNIFDAVISFYNLDLEELLSDKRNKEVVKPRQVAMYLMRNELNYSYPQIAMKTGKKDHTTIIYAVKKIEKQIKNDQDLQKELLMIKEKFYS